MTTSCTGRRSSRRSTLLLPFVVFFGALVVACGGTVKRPDGGEGLLPVGSAAPDFVGRAPASEGGGEIRLSGVRGKPAVVYFYPADGTPGCTKEACAFRDAWNDFKKADVVVFGVSDNDAASHAKFQSEEKLPFPLVADDGGNIARAYGVSKKLWGFDRVTFLVGRDGKIAHVWPDVDPGVHAREVLAEASRLP